MRKAKLQLNLVQSLLYVAQGLGYVDQSLVWSGAWLIDDLLIRDKVESYKLNI